MPETPFVGPSGAENKPPYVGEDVVTLKGSPDPVTGELVVDILAVMEGLEPGMRLKKVLDYGEVELIDLMPRLIPTQHLQHLRCDIAATDAARISYRKGTRRRSDEAGLIDYLVRKEHGTPIEMVELKWRERMPILTMRQHVRHRMSSMNEESARYSQLENRFFIPDPSNWRVNSESNKQATVGGVFTTAQTDLLTKLIKDHNELSYKLYEALLNEAKEPEKVSDGGDSTTTYDSVCDELLRAANVPALAREQARMVLGVNIYTNCIWKTDLRNMLGYLKLRCDAHAQYEIRVYADVQREHVKFLAPNIWSSFEDHHVKNINLGFTEGLVFRALIQGDLVQARTTAMTLGWSVRRLSEFTDKLKNSVLGESFKDDRIQAFKVMASAAIKEEAKKAKV